MFALNTWSEYPLTDICFVEYGNKFDLNKMDVSDGAEIAFISRTACNNGISAWVNRVDAIQPYPKGRITIALGGSIGETFLQDQAFYTGQNVAVLSTKENISREAKLFLISVIKAECSLRFVAFGRELNKHIKKDFKVSLPSKTDGTPDWQYMENYIGSLEGREDRSGRTVAKSLQSKNASRCERVETKDWKEFELTKLFSRFEVGKAHAGDLEDGDDCLYLGAKKDDNSVMRNCARNEEKMHKGNCVVFICNGEGSVGYVNYMNRDFIATTDLVMGYSKKLNQYSGMFLVGVLDLERPKYSFGRKWKTHLKDTRIRLPATPLGDPDWAYMENYIRSLPYGDRI